MSPRNGSGARASPPGWTISHRTRWSRAGSRSTSRRRTPTSSMCRRAARPIPKVAKKLDGRVYETAAPAAWFLGIDSKGVAATGDPCEWRAPIRVKPDVKRVSGGYKVSFAVLPRGATIRATFDGSDPKTGRRRRSRSRCAERRDAASRRRGGQWAVQPGRECAASDRHGRDGKGGPSRKASSSRMRPP